RGSRYYDVPIDAALTPEQRERAARSISLLERYVEEFPDRPQADDAAHWLGWLEAARGQVETSLAWLGRVRSLGNGDYAQGYGFSRALSFKIILETRGLTDALPLLPESDRRWVIDGYLLKAHQALHRFRVDSARVMLEEVRAAAETTGAPVSRDEIALLESTIGIVDGARRAGTMEAYASAASRLRRELFERHVAAGVAEEGLGRFSRDPDRDRLHYLKIVAMREIWPDSVEASVRAFLERFPGSGLADDALAELVYVKAYSLAEPDEARDFLLLLEQRFPAGNALDNASNWVALGYRELCENPWRGRAVEDPCGKAQEMYARIAEAYAHTRFAPISRDELMELVDETGF
ncbi:MAG TPA: hypothetical protein VLL48_05725, partial [Longimicrobiales bacterium]|nr:hypothetical protein [Longimicrobiales bacterium]